MMNHKHIAYEIKVSDSETISNTVELTGDDLVRDVIVIGLDGVLAQKELPANLNLQVYPSPADQYIHINIEGGNADKLSIYSENGVLIDSQTISQNQDELELFVGNYPTGLYYIQIGASTQSFIKQ